MDAIRQQYGFIFPQKTVTLSVVSDPSPNPEIVTSVVPTPWTWDDLASVGNGAWIVARALENYSAICGERVVKGVYDGTTVMTIAGDFTASGSSLVELVRMFGNALGITPPPGIGGTGNVVFLKSGQGSIMNTVFIR
jgi:hypothetical protein